MDLWDALVNLLIGGVCVIPAVQVFVKYRSILGTVVWLSFGVAITIPVLLALKGLIAAEWVDVCRNAVLGIGMTLAGISALYSPPSASFPNWTRWATLVFGIGAIFWAILGGLSYYWR